MDIKTEMLSWRLRYRYARRVEKLGWFTAAIVTAMRELGHGPIDPASISPPLFDYLMSK